MSLRELFEQANKQINVVTFYFQIKLNQNLYILPLDLRERTIKEPSEHSETFNRFILRNHVASSANSNKVEIRVFGDITSNLFSASSITWYTISLSPRFPINNRGSTIFESTDPFHSTKVRYSTISITRID